MDSFVNFFPFISVLFLFWFYFILFFFLVFSCIIISTHWLYLYITPSGVKPLNKSNITTKRKRFYIMSRYVWFFYVLYLHVICICRSGAPVVKMWNHPAEPKPAALLGNSIQNFWNLAIYMTFDENKMARFLILWTQHLLACRTSLKKSENAIPS